VVYKYYVVVITVIIIIVGLHSSWNKDFKDFQEAQLCFSRTNIICMKCNLLYHRNTQVFKTIKSFHLFPWLIIINRIRWNNLNLCIDDTLKNYSLQFKDSSSTFKDLISYQILSSRTLDFYRVAIVIPKLQTFPALSRGFKPFSRTLF